MFWSFIHLIIDNHIISQSIFNLCSRLPLFTLLFFFAHFSLSGSSTAATSKFNFVKKSKFLKYAIIRDLTDYKIAKNKSS